MKSQFVLVLAFILGSSSALATSERMDPCALAAASAAMRAAEGKTHDRCTSALPEEKTVDPESGRMWEVTVSCDESDGHMYSVNTILKKNRRGHEICVANEIVEE